VSAVSEDEGRSDDYWMGVRDALRMVDSFLRWSERNRSRAKSLEEFINDGLIAAAKRCESCLSEKLGVKFGAQEDAASGETSPDTFRSSVKSLSEAGVEALSESSSEYVSEEYEESVASPPEPPEEALTVDDVDRVEEESLSHYDVEGPPRDFTSDFDLIEPTPLVVEPDHDYSDMSEEEPEAESDIVEESAAEEEDEGDSRDDIASFTWADYEKAVAPSEDSETVEGEEEESEDIPEPWTPYDEPSIPDEELSRELEEEPTPEEGLLEEEEEEANTPVTHPPPPPPPESDEDEEERKRRARRLFFGA
jgi:hypothetical protein